jgi:hypothetical protein
MVFASWPSSCLSKATSVAGAADRVAGTYATSSLGSPSEDDCLRGLVFRGVSGCFFVAEAVPCVGFVLYDISGLCMLTPELLRDFQPCTAMVWEFLIVGLLWLRHIVFSKCFCGNHCHSESRQISSFQNFLLIIYIYCYMLGFLGGMTSAPCSISIVTQQFCYVTVSSLHFHGNVTVW